MGRKIVWVMMLLVVGAAWASADELKTLRVVVGSGGVKATELGEEAKIVAEAIAKEAPKHISGFVFEDGVLTVLARITGKTDGAELFKATHVSDCPVNSIYAFQAVELADTAKPIMLRVAEAWCRARHRGGFDPSTKLQSAYFYEEGRDQRIQVILKIDKVAVN